MFTNHLKRSQDLGVFLLHFFLEGGSKSGRTGSIRGLRSELYGINCASPSQGSPKWVAPKSISTERFDEHLWSVCGDMQDQPCRKQDSSTKRKTCCFPLGFPFETSRQPGTNSKRQANDGTSQTRVAKQVAKAIRLKAMAFGRRRLRRLGVWAALGLGFARRGQ